MDTEDEVMQQHATRTCATCGEIFESPGAKKVGGPVNVSRASGRSGDKLWEKLDAVLDL